MYARNERSSLESQGTSGDFARAPRKGKPDKVMAVLLDHCLLTDELGKAAEMSSNVNHLAYLAVLPTTVPG